MLPGLAEAIATLPDRPGIYLFIDPAGKALYVGKAKSLRKRVANYRDHDLEPRLAAMVEEAASLEFLVTASESEALELENNWIKRHRPRYNVLLRDDKTYPYLKLTLGEEYPRLAFTRRVRQDGSEYFGPFLPGGLARKAIKLVQKLFRVRVCRIPIDGLLPRPCLYWDMKRCLGPCVAGLTTHAEYAAAVGQARLFLAGRTEPLLRELRREMEEAAERLEFERAARLRDALREVEGISGRSRLSSLDEEDADVYGLEVREHQAALVILVMRGGRILDRRELFWEEGQPLAAAPLLAEILPHIYDRTTFIPKEVHLPVEIEGAEALADWLSQRKEERVYLRFPARGPKAARLELARRNAELAFRRRFRGGLAPDAGAEGLQRHLDLPDLPRRIEGFDISNTQGSEIVAARVVWENGRMRRGQYRSFNIRGLSAPDDFAAMRQVVTRHYRRQLEETAEMPDLILIDGGRGQLNAALAALAELGAEEVAVVGLAKREEEIYLAGVPEPLALPLDDPGLQLLQRIRDEAHRFALSRHRARRSRRILTSRLEQLAGVGPARRKLLLRELGSADAVRAASAERLQQLLGPRLGAAVHAQLQAAVPPDGGDPSSGGGPVAGEG